MNPISKTPGPSLPLRIGVVGAGKMGQHHLRAIERLPALARVTGMADPQSGAREAAAEIAPSARVHASDHDLLAAGDLDVVHVCTAPRFHEAVAVRAIEAGCHIYVEKPFMEDVRSAERVLSLAGERGVRVCAGHQLLFEPPTRRALELLPALREVVHLESYFSFRPVRTSSDGRAAMPPDEQLLDILPHPVYLLLRFLEEAEPEGTTEIVSVRAGPAGTVHAAVRRGRISSDLTVTLEGRPVESYLRIVGRNGTVHADYVRGTVQRLIGPGTSGIDKVLNPFRLSRQFTVGTVKAVGARLLRRQRSYPGLVEIFQAFYESIENATVSPTPEWSIIETARFSERIAAELKSLAAPLPAAAPAARASLAARDANASAAASASGQGTTAATGQAGGLNRDADAPERAQEPSGAPGLAAAEPRRVLVTGGTGFLGREVVRRLLEDGMEVTVAARREPVGWERIPAVRYAVLDLGEPLPEGELEGIDLVIHCAAETAGGWDAHRRNSIDATRNLLEACVRDGAHEVIHVSSIAVLAPPAGKDPVREDSPCHADPESAGPYVWGKLESERIARDLGRADGMKVRIVRPPALVDYRRFEAPGKLGKTIGNMAVAVGSPGEELAVLDVEDAGKAIAWMAGHMDEVPETLNLLPSALPSRRELVSRLKRTNPDLRVVWLPRLALHPLSWLALGAQKVLRPGAAAISVARVFAPQNYDNTRSGEIASLIERYFEADRVEGATAAEAEAEGAAAAEAVAAEAEAERGATAEVAVGAGSDGEQEVDEEAEFETSGSVEDATRTTA